jgi:hypothetical protein
MSKKTQSTLPQLTESGAVDELTLAYLEWLTEHLRIARGLIETLTQLASMSDEAQSDSPQDPESGAVDELTLACIEWLTEHLYLGNRLIRTLNQMVAEAEADLSGACR